ncbi:MAG: sulfite exporter TauE/SafE family protein [Lachnospiraceae bacterium]|nr:sulfite exporter TauE/SafE family protein [Lachnospiraceae bacterium]
MAEYFLISFLASIVGAICGIGGGVIIKPVMDLFRLETVSTINFLSCCTVLSMSLYSVGKTMLAGEKKVELRTGTPLALGAAIGGIFGKELFQLVRQSFADPDMVGAVQAGCLAAVTIGTLVYTLKRSRIRTRHVENLAGCIGIGLALGVMSSFLGIGGGPINLVVLYYFFSMDTKTAAANSLYIILFSQAASFFSTIVTHSVPAFHMGSLALMVAGGIGGGIVGRAFNKKLDNRAVDRLFIGLMAVIIGISLYNVYIGLTA